LIVPVELVLPAIPLTTGFFDTQVLKHVMLAGPIVKLVLLLLIGFSVVSWAIIFLKFRLFKGIERNQGGFARAFAEGKSMSALYEQAEKGEKSPLTEVFRAGYLELTRIQRERGEASQAGRTAPFPVENVYRTMYKTTHEQVGGMEDLLPFIATTGSATPFIGLFGTVWGIMNSFRGLANVQQATLANVAPGIAEALVATAIGLFAAIPAVIGYNRYTHDVDRLATRYETFIEEFSNILQRQS